MVGSAINSVVNYTYKGSVADMISNLETLHMNQCFVIEVVLGKFRKFDVDDNTIVPDLCDYLCKYSSIVLT